MYLLWVLRCERVIQDRQHSVDAIVTRWKNAINRRLDIDRTIASRIRRSPRAIKKVAQTWHGTLADEHLLPRDWASRPEVLAGIRAPIAPIQRSLRVYSPT
ncbi:hypothetical protein OE88DRAFT_1659836 [Heliocybe sulcata]|uniref:Uncharacterized protein n=1 Tax=Heliocybe sulcata TaxID=5364 RepID=A0A5C3N159_9AGAM|nr:hypothetical protein OE88DRAFT_1659836 [Heliocybe sulcata]